MYVNIFLQFGEYYKHFCIKYNLLELENNGLRIHKTSQKLIYIIQYNNKNC